MVFHARPFSIPFTIGIGSIDAARLPVKCERNIRRTQQTSSTHTTRTSDEYTHTHTRARNDGCVRSVEACACMCACVRTNGIQSVSQSDEVIPKKRKAEDEKKICCSEYQVPFLSISVLILLKILFSKRKQYIRDVCAC